MAIMEAGTISVSENLIVATNAVTAAGEYIATMPTLLGTCAPGLVLPASENLEYLIFFPCTSLTPAIAAGIVDTAATRG